MREDIRTLVRQIGQLEKEVAKAREAQAAAQAVALRHTQDWYKLQQNFELLVEITSLTTAANQTEDILPVFLRLFCTYMRWPVGHVLIRDPQSPQHLISSGNWFSSLLLPIDKLQRVTDETRFDQQTGLPGQVLATGQPVWLVDLGKNLHCARAKSAIECGVQYALAFPVKVQGEICAVLEFFSEDPIDSELLTQQVISQAAVQLADVFQRSETARVEGLYAKQLENNAEQLFRIAQIGSHDLQEPLRKIEMFMSRIQRSDGDSLSRSGKESLEKMGIAARRMSALVQDLLRLVYVATDQWKFSRVNLNRLLEKLVKTDLKEGLEADDDIRIDALPQLWAEPDVVKMVLRELLDNSIQFRAPDRALQLRVEHHNCGDGHLEIRITDNGVGFPPTYAAKMFEPFERLHHTRSTEHTGVGLAVCRRAVERIGGTLSGHSDGPGSGARFTLRLPETLLYRSFTTNQPPN